MKWKNSLKRIRYRFDCIMSRGPAAMALLLFAATLLAIAVFALAAFLVSGEGSIVYQLWMSLLHTIDPGTIAGDTTDNIPYLLLMFAATLFGLFFTSILIAVIAAGVESKLSELRKGSSVVMESGHTVIIGYDSNTYDLLSELVEANSNKSNACIVVLGAQPKLEMEDALFSLLPQTGKTRIICRSGSLYEAYSLERCSVETAQSVIVNIHNDTETVKVLLSLSNYLRGRAVTQPEFHIVASILDRGYIEAARIAGGSYARIIHAKDAISRIIANTCRQHGLSQVLTELFNFGGNEFYFEAIPQMTGKSFGEALLCFSNAVPAGLYSGAQVLLNPPMERIIEKDDLLILIEEDEGAYRLHEAASLDCSLISSGSIALPPTGEQLIVLGSNDKLPTILSEYSLYASAGTRVVITDDDLDEDMLPECSNLSISVCKRTVTQQLLREYLDGGAHNFLLLNDDSLEPEVSDSQTLLRLILLRDIADRTQRHITITTEMRSSQNQKLATQARVDDFVIGSNFNSLLMAQISENGRIIPLIDDILDENGSEFYMRPASDYVRVGVPVNSYVLTESAARRGEIFVGYRLHNEATQNVVVNPKKDESLIFGEKDCIVVIAQE